MPESNELLSVGAQLIGLPLAGPESYSQQQLAYLKRALGVDETVLWSGTSSSTIPLSESAENFERVKILYKINDGISSSVEVMPNASGVKVGMCTIAFYVSEIRMKGTFYTLQGTSLTPEANSAVASGSHSGTLALATETGTFYVLQVIGINRISS